MTARSVHGLAIETDDSSDPWFSEFASTTSEPRIRVTTRRGALPPISSSSEPWYFHGTIQLWRSAAEIVVAGGHAQAHVRAGVIEAWLEPDGRADEVETVLRVACLVTLREAGMFELHAAGVCEGEGDARCALIVGDSGAGKTTLTLAFLAAGFSHMGDDTLLLRRAPALEALYFPRPFAVSEKTVEAFPELSPHRSDRDANEGKWRVDPRAFTRASRHSAKPAWMLLPSIADAEVTTVAEGSRADAFTSLLRASALVIVPEIPRRDDQIDILRTLANECTIRNVSLGRDLLERPRETALRVWRDVLLRD